MIYFIAKPDRSAIKIGTTIRLSQRLRQLAYDHGDGLEVLAVTDGSYETERDIHARFAHLRGAGEWFDPGDDLVDFIASKAKPWDGRNETNLNTLVRMDDDLCEKAGVIAAMRGVSMGDLFAEWLRPIVDRKWTKRAQAWTPPPKAKKRMMTIKLNDQDYADVRMIADNDCMSVAECIGRILHDFVAKESEGGK